VGTYGNEVVAFKPGEGSIVWRYKDRSFPFFSSPAVTSELIVIGGRDKRLHAIERATGKARWIFQTRGVIDSSSVICGETVLFGSADGRVYCVRLADGKEAWSYTIGASIIASPAVADGVVVIGAEDGSLYALGEGKP
jgi:outer membrane protein assembly factor BamB